MSGRSRGSRVLTLPKQLIRRFGTRDPFQIAEALGCQVRFIATDRQKGFCVRVLKQYFIFIRQDMSEQMQRMCCAHELPHILLHKDYLGTADNMMHMELFDMRNQTEYEANLFAAALLIDDAELEERLREGMDIVAVASCFDVNVNLVALKLASTQKPGRSVDLPFTPDRRFLGRIADRSDSL